MPSQTQAAEETRLIQRLQARDEAALETLMAQYGTRIFGLALRLTGNRQDAEEVLQDVLWAILQNIGSFRGDSKLSTWIYRITMNRALMKVRGRPKSEHLPLDFAEAPPVPDPLLVEVRLFLGEEA